MSNKFTDADLKSFAKLVAQAGATTKETSKGIVESLRKRKLNRNEKT